MIRIEIIDASTAPAFELRAIAACLIAIAEGQGVDKPASSAVNFAHVELRDSPKQADIKQSIAAADRPDAGAPTIEPATVGKYATALAAVLPPVGETLREPAIDPKVAFGGNAPAATASSIAVAAALPTALAVPPVTSTAPAPAPLPPVPAAPATAARTDEDAPSDAQFDKTDLPWDARIHSRGRSMNSDGTWRAKRGVDDATVAAVVAELRGVPAAPATTLADDVAQAEASWPFKVPAVPAAPVAPPAPPAAPVAVSFPDFMARVVPAVAAGQITEVQVTTILGEFGIPSLPLLATRPDLLPKVASRIDALIAGGAQ